MARKPRLADRDIHVIVYHADAFDRPIAADEYEDDLKLLADTGAISWAVGTGEKSPRLLEVQIKHGVSRQTATKLLRQIADAIDESPEHLLSAHEGASGYFDISQRAFIDEWGGMADLDGKTPEIL